MATELNYKRAHREWAFPEWEKLSIAVKALYCKVQEGYEGTSQLKDLSMPWLAGFEGLFDQIDMDVLAHARSVIYHLGYWDSKESADLHFPRDKHGAYWKFDRLARQNLVKRGNKKPYPNPPLAQFMEHKEGTEYDNNELATMLKPMFEGHFSVLKIDYANYRIVGRPSIAGHPFVIGRKHFQNNSMILDPRCAPCTRCGHSYDDHVSDRIIFLKPLKGLTKEGDKYQLDEESAIFLHELDDVFDKYGIDGIAFAVSGDFNKEDSTAKKQITE